MERDVFNQRIEVAEKRLEALTEEQRQDSSGLWDELSAALGELRAAGEALHRQRESEREGQMANNLLRSLLDVMPVGVIICDRDGAILMNNPAAEDILGSLVVGDMRRPKRTYTPHRLDGSPFPSGEMPLVRALEHGEVARDVEILIKRADDTERAILAGAAPVCDGAGHIISGVAVFQDITRHKQAKEVVENLARFPSENPNPVIRVMKDGVIHYSNQGGQCLLDKWQTQIGEQVPDEWQILVVEALEAGLDRTAEILCNERTFAFTIVPVVESGYVNLYGLDVTKRKQAEEGQRRLAAILEATPDIVSTSTVDGCTLYLNQTARRLLGIPDDTTPPDWVIPAGYPGWASEIVQREGIPTALQESYWEGETVVVGDDGREIPVSQVIIAHRNESGEVAYLSAVARDVTEYKRLMADLKEERTRAENERRRLEAVMEALPVGVAVTDALGGDLQVNEAYDLVWGGAHPAPATVSDYTAYQAWWADTGKVVAPEEWASAQAVQKGKPVVGQLLEIQRFDGARASVINSASPIYDADGNIAGSTVVIQDITDLRKAEEELRVALEKYRVLFEAFPLGITISDRVGNILESNREAERLLGVSQAEHTRRSIDGSEWQIIRLDGSLMPSEEYASVRALQENRLIDNVEMGIVKGAGDITWINVTAAPIPLEDYGVAVAYGDITEHRRMEEALRESEARYRELFDTSRDGLVFTDMDGRYMECNRAYLDLLGYETLEELRGKSYAELTPVEYHQMEERIIQEQTLSRGYCDEYEKEYIRKAGERVPVSLKAWLRLDADQKPVGMWAIVRDITERRQAREERERLLATLDRERRTLQGIMENTPTYLAYLDPQFNFVMVNPAYAEGSGYTEEQIIGRGHFELFPHEENQAIFERVRETGEPLKFVAKPFEFPDRPELGTTYWDWTLTPVKDADGQILGLVLSLMDVTEQEQARQRLQLYVGHLHVLHEADQAILVARSVDEIAESALGCAPQLLEGCVRASVALYDLDQGEVSLLSVHTKGETSLGKGWRDSMDPAWVSMFEVLAQGKPHVIEDMQAISATSTFVGTLQTEGLRAYVAVPMLIEGKLIGFLDFGMSDAGGLTSDQMEVAVGLADELAVGIRQAHLNEQVQRHAEELESLVARRTRALRDREARLRAIFDNAALGIVIVDLEGQLLETNQALQTMLGYSGEELHGMHLAEFTHPKDVEADIVLYRELTAGERDSYAIEKRYIRKDGRTVQARSSFSLIRNPEDKSRFGVVLMEDISEQRRAQEALIQAEKLTITGRLAASLAHEINNPLQSVIGCLGLARESLETGEEEEVRELLQVAAEELRRAAGFVSDLRDLNRPADSGDRKPVEVNLQIEHVMMLTREQCQKRGVEVKWQPAAGLPTLMLAPDRMHQVFLNLTLNALEAMPGGGRLRIGTDCTGDPAWVRVTFADTGSGIAPDDLSHVFEPFYTTKTEGLGLGLYITRNIIEEHGGRIEVESLLGEGTTFTMWLPVGEGTCIGED
jgi:PAS domain S-box-containing protein